MKVILLGNSGAGKTTLAKRLTAHQPAALLSLDAVAFDGTAQRRPLEASLEDVQGFISSHSSWIIEGCYADIIGPILPLCEELIFLNPGVETCLAHCRARPWEPEKFSSQQQQDAHLHNLLDWVRAYPHRTDAYGYAQHRQLFDSFPGPKRELTHIEREAPARL
jgi:adenylate kinase family enzyme